MQLSSFSLLLEETFGSALKYNFHSSISLKFRGARVKEALTGQDHLHLFLGFHLFLVNRSP